MLTIAERTKQFAVRIVRMYVALPRSEVAQVLGKQVLRSGTSVGAHFREAERARSTAEFVSKVEVGLQELAETEYWLELLIEADILPPRRLTALRQEAVELTAILVTCVKKAKERRRKDEG